MANSLANSTIGKTSSGAVHGVSNSLQNAGRFVSNDMWKASTWKNAEEFFFEGAMSMSTVKVYNTPMVDAKSDEFINKVIKGDAYSRADYFAEFGTNLATGYLLDKGLGELSSLKVFTNTGKTFQSASIRFTQNTVNDFGEAIAKVSSGKYDPINIVKMEDGIYSSVDNTRLLAAQRLGVNIKSAVHTFDEALPENMVKWYKNNKTGEYAKTWGEAIQFRTSNQSGGFAKQYGSNGTFVQPEIRSH
jgi:hypothetical protein